MSATDDSLAQSRKLLPAVAGDFRHYFIDLKWEHLMALDGKTGKLVFGAFIQPQPPPLSCRGPQWPNKLYYDQLQIGLCIMINFK